MTGLQASGQLVVEGSGLSTQVQPIKLFLRTPVGIVPDRAGVA